MEWSEIRLGTREEALVNAHEQSLSLPVSAREVTIKRGDEQSHFLTREKLILNSSSFSSLKRLLSNADPQNTLPFDFHSSL